MRTLDDDEIDDFLLAGTRTGKLATVRPDGRPHVAPVWFTIDGRDVVFCTFETTVKAANLTHEPRAALSVDDQTPPYGFVLVEGTVILSDRGESEEKRAWATKIAERYMGADQAEDYGRRNSQPGEYLCRLTPTSRIGQVALAAWE